MKGRAVALIGCCVFTLSACVQSRETRDFANVLPTNTVLDDFIAFSDPVACQETDAFREFLSDLIVFTDDLEAHKGKITAPKSVAGAFGDIKFAKGRHGFVATVPTKGNWKGFGLTAISTFAPKGGDPPDFTLHLSAPVANVARRLKADGFDVVTGESKTVDDAAGVYSLSITLVSDPNNPRVTLFGCGLS